MKRFKFDNLLIDIERNPQQAADNLKAALDRDECELEAVLSALQLTYRRVCAAEGPERTLQYIAQIFAGLRLADLDTYNSWIRDNGPVSGLGTDENTDMELESIASSLENRPDDPRLSKSDGAPPEAYSNLRFVFIGIVLPIAIGIATLIFVGSINIEKVSVAIIWLFVIGALILFLIYHFASEHNALFPKKFVIYFIISYVLFVFVGMAYIYAFPNT
jgi:hypothetical protein